MGSPEFEALLAKLSSLSSVSDEDDLWKQIGSLSLELRPTSREDEEAFDTQYSPLLKQFSVKNCSSGNLATLSKLCVAKCQQLLCVSVTDLNQAVTPVKNLLFILRMICRFFIERMPVEALQRHMTICRPTPTTPFDSVDKSARDNDSVTGEKTSPPIEIEAGIDRSLCNALISVLSNIPLSNGTLKLHEEAISMVIVLLSTKMFDERKAEENVFFENLLINVDQNDANLLTKRLLQNCLCPVGSQASDYQSDATGMFGTASKLLRSMSPFSNNDPETLFTCSKSFADKSLLLLEILTNHCTMLCPETEQESPFRSAISSFIDFSLSLAAYTENSDTKASFSISFDQLYLRLCENLDKDHNTIILYMLLHKNTAFLNYVLSRTDPEKLLLPLLQVLYTPNQASSHHLYMILIILLILSEDTILNNVISEIALPHVTWFTEKLLTDLSLSSLMVLVLLRTIQVNITEMKDKYLHTNCLATLANMSNHFQNLNQYCAQKLVRLTFQLSKKQVKLNQQLTKVVNDDSLENKLRTELAVIEEILRLLLEIINNAIANQLIYNSSLVHCLIYEKELLESLRMNHNFQDIVFNLDKVVNFFLGRMDRSKERLSLTNCGSVARFIKENSKVFPIDQLQKFPALKFKYCEEEAPEDFFIPYIWSIAYRNSTIFWNINFVTLFKFVL